MDIYSEQHGFENKKVRTEKDKDGQLRKRRFDCEHSGKYKPKKTAIIENQRNVTSKKTECGFRVNFSYTKAKGFISITRYLWKPTSKRKATCKRAKTCTIELWFIHILVKMNTFHWDIIDYGLSPVTFGRQTLL